jgi:hypothetical protein
MPKRISDVLGRVGIKAQHAEDRGWGELTNGALVEAAV